jgi:hypothetical protein
VCKKMIRQAVSVCPTLAGEVHWECGTRVEKDIPNRTRDNIVNIPSNIFEYNLVYFLQQAKSIGFNLLYMTCHCEIFPKLIPAKEAISSLYH